jgi:hypothetical protein
MPKILFLLLVLLCCQCKPLTPRPNLSSDTYRPVYMPENEATTISIAPPRPLRATGKIYTKDSIVLIQEPGRGIHLIDNHDPRNPRTIAFLAIPGCNDLAMKGTVLYSNNFNDLVALDLSNLSSIRVVKRVENAFPKVSSAYPPYTSVRFECPDPAKGKVVGWEKVTLTNPKCFR